MTRRTDLSPSASFRLKSDPSSKTSMITPTSSSSISTEPIVPLLPSASEKEVKSHRAIESFAVSAKSISADKKWLVSFLITFVALLIFSTFSVSIIDQFLFKRGIDLFTKDSTRNQIYLTIGQFILLFIFIRVVFFFILK